MFLKNFHIFIKKRAVLQQKYTVQVTTLADCDDITRFDGTHKVGGQRPWGKKAYMLSLLQHDPFDPHIDV